MAAMRAFLLCLATIALLGCSSKPSEADCRKAIDKINELYGIKGEADIDVALSRCRSQWSKKSVACALGAQTKEQLEACLGSAPTK